MKKPGSKRQTKSVLLRLSISAAEELYKRAKDSNKSLHSIVEDLLALPPPQTQLSIAARLDALEAKEAQLKASKSNNLSKTDVERMISEAISKLQRGY